MGERLFHLVYQHKAQITWFQPFQRCINSQELTPDFVDTLGTRGLGQALA